MVNVLGSRHPPFPARAIGMLNLSHAFEEYPRKYLYRVFPTGFQEV